jgi:amidase/aspartyl-tRNA(Asn)/glutamyl-tRNA(Gln) amidotransferase subunit A
MPARDIATLLQDLQGGRTTASALLDHALAAARSPACAHAFCQLDEDGARAAARAHDQRPPSAAASLLAGVPVSIKDLFDVRGQPTRAGGVTPDLATPASSDAPAVARLRAAGAVLVGRTQMSEFAFSGVGINPHQGTPANPALAALGRPGRIPGGSTAGGAVSVAAGAAWAALGSDTGGSIRIPAALHGLVGFKNSQALTPLAGAFPLAPSLDTVCAITRSVRDALRLHAVLADRPVTPDPRPLSARRAAVVGRHFLEGLAPAVAQAFEQALARLRAAGLTITDLDLPELDRLADLTANGGITAAESWRGHAERLAAHEAAYDPRVVARIRRGAAIDDAALAALRARRRCFIADVGTRLAAAGAELVLSPTVPIEAPRIDDLLASDEAFFRDNALLLRNPMVVNLLDGCALSLPCQRPGDAPVGLMAWALNGQDDALLHAGLAIEAALAPADRAATA